MQIRKKIKYSKDNNGQINIIYNIPDEVYADTRIKGMPFARLKVGHPRLFKIFKELHDLGLLAAIVVILIGVELTAIMIELLVNFCVRPVSELEVVLAIVLLLIIILLACIQYWIDKMFEKSEPYYIRSELFKAIVYDETRIYPGYSDKKKKITDIEIDCNENPYICSNYIYCQFSTPFKNGESCTVEFWFEDDLKYETIIKRK